MIDTHTHCYHSHDSTQDPEQSILYAIDHNVEYLAFTDHCDKDIVFVPKYSHIRQIDLNKHFEEIRYLKEKYKDKIEIGVGIECGFALRATPLYEEIIKKYPTDIIINSVHLVGDADCYFKECFLNKTKKQAYYDYLKTIMDSVNAPYHWDTLAHIGYVCRKAPFEDKYLHYKDFSDQIDYILNSLISKGKSLEINTHSEGTQSAIIPTIEIVKRYKELGGELLTFASDAHIKENICKNYNSTISLLKDLGFSYIFKYINHEPIAVKI